MTPFKVVFATVALLVPLALAGCGGGGGEGQDQAAKIEAERAKLAPEERKDVDAQDCCAVMTKTRLGSMGAPLKVTIKDRPVYVCCKNCIAKAQKDPDKTLAAVDALKAKASQTDAK